MIDWIKHINKPSPDFWKKYVAKFEEKSNRYIAISLESTGLNPKKDTILSYGAVSIINDTILISDSFEVILSENNNTEISNDVAVEMFVDFIENAVLIGYHIDFDVQIINEALEKLHCGRLKNEALDIEIMYKKLQEDNDSKFSLAELITIFKIPKSDRVSASEDAFSIALLFLKLKSRLGLK